MHLGLAAETLYVGLEVALVGADGAAQGVVILKGGAEAKWQDSREFEAVSDDAGVVFCGLLVQPCGVLFAVFGYDDSQIAGWKKKCLITEEP